MWISTKRYALHMLKALILASWLAPDQNLRTAIFYTSTVRKTCTDITFEEAKQCIRTFTSVAKNSIEITFEENEQCIRRVKYKKHIFYTLMYFT